MVSRVEKDEKGDQPCLTAGRVKLILNADRSSYSAFMDYLSSMFAVKDSELAAGLKLLSLKQKEQEDCVNFVAKFQSLATVASFNDSALRCVFLEALNPRVRAVIRTRGEVPQTMEDFYNTRRPAPA